MNSDILRGVRISARGSGAIPAAGYTGNSALATDWLDTAGLVGPITAVAESEANSAISGTLSIEHATSASGASGATVTADSDFPGGREAQGANTTGGVDWAAGTAASAALSYNGTRRYVRAHLTVRNSTNATVNADVSVVLMGMPQVTPDR